MRHFRFSRYFAAALVLSITARALAQDSAETRMANPWDRAGGPGDRLKDKELSAKQMFDMAKSYVQKMQISIRRDEKKRAQALLGKDLIKVNCLNDKLTQAAAYLKAADQALSSMSDAIVDKDPDERTHEMNRLSIFYQKVLVLSAEADTCAGEDSSYVGSPRIQVEVDPTVPQGDPTDPGLPTPNFSLAPAGIEEAVPDSVVLNNNLAPAAHANRP